MAESLPRPGPNSTVAERLRWARIEIAKSPSPRQFAADRNLVVETYRKHESGERGRDGLKDHHVKRYARALKVSEYWLKTGMGLPQAPNVDELSEEEARVILALREAKKSA